MRRLLVPTVMAAIVASSTMAFAAAQQDTGMIKSVDSVMHRITLADGKDFTLAKNISPGQWHVGDKVKVTYTTANGVNTASAVEAAK
jgi:hypothetical protein